MRNLLSPLPFPPVETSCSAGVSFSLLHNPSPLPDSGTAGACIWECDST